MRVWTLLAAAMLLLGCEGWPMGSGGSRHADAPPPAEAAARPASSEVMAYVNSRPIYMDVLYDLLVRSGGPRTAMQLIAAELVEQEAAKAGLTVTDQDLAAEEDQSLKETFGFIAEPQRRRRVLESILARERISEKHWRMVLRQNSLLTKLAAPRTQVGQAELEAEFEMLYGRKVRVRHIQTSSPQTAQNILRQLKAGASFAELARQHSENPTAQDGGLLPEMTAATPNVPPPIKAAALAMTTVGEVAGPVAAGTGLHLLYLEQVTPAQNVVLADVREKVTASAARRRVRHLRREILDELFRKAKIEYVHPVLKAKAEEGIEP